MNLNFLKVNSSSSQLIVMASDWWLSLPLPSILLLMSNKLLKYLSQWAPFQSLFRLISFLAKCLHQYFPSLLSFIHAITTYLSYPPMTPYCQVLLDGVLILTHFRGVLLMFHMIIIHLLSHFNSSRLQFIAIL